MREDHIAIIGAGFSGLATAWNLLKKGCRVTVYDSLGIGGGASGIAAGLMHPYAGLHAKLNWMGKEGFWATCQLIDIAEKALGRSVAEKTGVLRVAHNQEQQEDFLRCAQQYSGIRIVTSEECAQIMPQINPAMGIWIPEGVVVDSKEYLKGLWQACVKLGGILRKERIDSLKQLDAYDAIVVAAGAGCIHFSELAHMPLELIKGQILEMAWPENFAPLSMPINAQAYLVMHPKRRACFVGATFERPPDLQPNIESAKRELKPKIEPLIPELLHSKILQCHVGIRISIPNRKPLAKRIAEKIWLLTGMGSKGLLYHALYGERLAEEILNNH